MLEGAQKTSRFYSSSDEVEIEAQRGAAACWSPLGICEEQGWAFPQGDTSLQPAQSSAGLSAETTRCTILHCSVFQHLDVSGKSRNKSSAFASDPKVIQGKARNEIELSGFIQTNPSGFRSMRRGVGYCGSVMQSCRFTHSSSRGR